MNSLMLVLFGGWFQVTLQSPKPDLIVLDSLKSTDNSLMILKCRKNFTLLRRKKNSSQCFGTSTNFPLKHSDMRYARDSALNMFGD